MTVSKEDVLVGTALFSALTPAEIQAVAQTMITRRFEPQEALFWERDPCQGLFLLASGTVKIFKTSSSGREITLAIETAPSTVAELPLFDGGPYPASARAQDEVTAYFINKGDFRQVCLNHPEVSLKILAQVGRRLRQLVATIEAMTFGSVTRRLARLILEESGGSNQVVLPGTHQELASRLGTVREVVSRNLARFRASGWIRLQGQTLEILDRAALEAEGEAPG